MSVLIVMRECHWSRGLFLKTMSITTMIAMHSAEMIQAKKAPIQAFRDRLLTRLCLHTSGHLATASFCCIANSWFIHNVHCVTDTYLAVVVNLLYSIAA